MIIVLYLFIAAFAILMVFYLLVFSRLGFYKSEINAEQADEPPVSVIICARNEATNIKKNLPHFLKQDYGEFEVIVVNDNSTDSTLEQLNSLRSQFPNLRIIPKVEKNKYKGKRNALETGIEAARFDHILLTDADCQPASNCWIKYMMANFSREKEIVLGFSPYPYHSGFLYQIFRFENFYTALLYLSFALVEKPYMGVGRNLAYKKSVYRGNKTFKTYNQLLSGDDDLLVNEMATNRNTSIMINTKAHVYTYPKPTMKEWLHQKRRHLTTGMYYKLEHQVMLGLLNGSQIMFNLSLLILIITGFAITTVLIIFIIKNLIQMLVFERAMNQLSIKKMWITIPLNDFIITALLITLSGLSLIKVKEWK